MVDPLQSLLSEAFFAWSIIHGFYVLFLLALTFDVFVNQQGHGSILLHGRMID